MNKGTCRFCGEGLSETFADLGMSPLSNSYLGPEHLGRMEPFYPLHAYVCSRCFLVQLDEFESPQDIFRDYAYFSSYSDSWLRHCKAFAERMLATCRLGTGSLVMELASNDGYLLQYFKAGGVPVLGIEPAANVAKVAEEKGIPTRSIFFGAETAARLREEGQMADLLIGNNVLAHVPDLNGFVRGMPLVLKPDGIVSMEFPHLLELMRENQFDTIYHEHFSYFSFLTVDRIFRSHGLTIFDVERLPTHGGSLRIFAKHADQPGIAMRPSVAELAGLEREAGLEQLATYRGFAEQVKETKRNLLEFLIQAKREGRRVVGYGAPAKGNTLLNYCGVREDFIDFTVDRSPHKQGTFLPGTHIPVKAPEDIRGARPDYVLILPWNIKQEIMEQMAFVKEWGGKFVVPIPRVEIC